MWAYFYLSSAAAPDSHAAEDDKQYIKIKLITTRLLESDGAAATSASDSDGDSDGECSNEVSYHTHDRGSSGSRKGKGKPEGFFRVACGGERGGRSQWLAIEELQPVGKRVTPAKNFFNGLRGRKLMYAHT